MSKFLLNDNEIPRFDITDMEQQQWMLNNLEENGYVVISSVASENEIKEAKINFWKFIENDNPNIKENDIKTWIDSNWLPSSENGICSGNGFNHNDFCWNTRLLPKVKKSFELLWNTDELITSFDAGNAFRPWKSNPSWLTTGGWWHTDQNALKGTDRDKKLCVQGLVTYYDATIDTGGLCVIEKSHKEHTALCHRNANGDNTNDYITIDENDPIFSTHKVKLICAKAGDLILWDSRLIHCNTPSPKIFDPASNLDIDIEDKDNVNNEIIRLVSYVCMLPRNIATANVIEQRKQAFIRRKPTSHWPDKKIGFNLKRIIENPVQLSNCSDDMLALVGYTKEERKVIFNT